LLFVERDFGGRERGENEMNTPKTRSESGEFVLGAMLDPGLTPLFWPPANCDRESAWLAHVPFVNWLVCAMKPRVFVEIGSPNGVSCATCCAVVKRVEPNARCVAVDPCAGINEAECCIGDSLKNGQGVPTERLALSSVGPGRLRDAIAAIADNSVDLLDVDAVRAHGAGELDLEIFKPKLSRSAIVLLYGTDNQEGDATIRQLWQKWETLYPSFEFLQALGLGVLCIGQTVPQPVLELCSLRSPEDIAAVRTRFTALGERWQLEARRNRLERDLEARDARIADFESGQSAEIHAVTAEAAAEIRRMTEMVKAVCQARTAAAEERTRQAMLQRDQVLSSITWRAARPLHRLLARAPKRISGFVLNLLNAGMRFVESAWRKGSGTANRESEVSLGGALLPTSPTDSRSADQRHRLRRTSATPGGSTKLADSLDLYDDRAVQEVVGPPREQVLWSSQRPDAIDTIWSAARFCIDLLRSRSELRQRFPHALSDGKSGEFAKWIASAGGDEFDLSGRARGKIKELFGRGIASRARQIFFFRDDLRAANPLGLMPTGRLGLFRWFIHVGQIEESFRLEEIWWFFLECAEDPARELVRTYFFTPGWQKLFPDGLTVFGRRGLATWLAETFHIKESWNDPELWPLNMTPSEQVRLAYRSREDWQSKFPNAFTTADSARALLVWLAGPESGLPEDIRGWCSQIDVDKTAAELAAPGVNILGHFCYPSGLRTSVEAIRDALGYAGVHVSLRDIRTDQSDDPNHVNFTGMELYDTTIVHTQPQPFFDVAFERADLFERIPRTYRIAYWYWELETIPESWLKRWQLVDEVWAATTFVTETLRSKSGARIYTMFPGIQLGKFEPRPRSYFGLAAEDEFTFLFVFHLMSVMERKNPLGLIRAFRQAFSASEPVRLVLKTFPGDRYPASLQEIRSAGAGAKITVIDRMFSQDETLSLIESCDAYVSLHRSEGLGLTMAEAMLLGKPVIATRYSGNLDFMDDANSLLVDYQLVPVGRTAPPYDPDGYWAEPSVDHAAHLMRQVYENRNWAGKLGAKAKNDAEDRMSLQSAGQRMAERLSQISAERRPTGSS
jgi:glycosyltransferase involved in cell wall biosynthesis